MYIMKNNKLLLKKIEAEQDDGLLVYTSDQRHESFEGIVIAAPGEPLAPEEYEEGDIVVFSQYEGSEVYINREKYLILDAESVWCVKKES